MLSFSGKFTETLHVVYHLMAGILRHLVKPPKIELDPRVLELEAAKDILAEVFKVRLEDVDEMIWVISLSEICIRSPNTFINQVTISRRRIKLWNSLTL